MKEAIKNKNEQEPKIIGLCSGCSRPIYEGDKGYIVVGEAYHKECFEKEFSVVF